jgi:hypothetical protein
MTAPNSIRFFFPRRPLSRIRRVDFNSTLTRSKIQKTTTKINVGMGIIMFALFSDGKRKKSTRSFQRCGSHEAETMKLTCRRHVKK